MGVIQPKSADTYLAELQRNVTNQSESVADVTTGGIVDTMLVPTAVLAEGHNQELRSVEGLITYANPESYAAESLIGPLSRDGVSFAGGRRAIGTLVFYRLTAPTVDPDPVPRGYPVGTSTDGRNVRIAVMATETRTMTVANAATYFSVARGRYELPVPAEAIEAGTNGNVAPGRLTRPLRGALPSGWDGVTNLVRFEDGTDSESNTSAVGRAALSVRGRQKATPTGIERTIRDTYPALSSTRVIFGRDSRLTRAETQANAIDVWVKPSGTTTVTDTFVFLGAGVSHTLSSQPVASVTNVTIDGTAYDADTEWELVRDTTDDRMGSVRAMDGVVIAGGASPTPVIGTLMVVTYEVQSSVRNAQALFTDAANAPGGADVLVRAATAVDIYVGIALRVVTGASYADVEAAVRTEVLNLVNTQRAQDDEIEAFDLSRAITDTGVDNITFTRLSRDPADATATDVVIDFDEYARLDEANIVIVPMA